MTQQEEAPTIIWSKYGWIARMYGSQHHTGIKHRSYTGRRCEYLAGDLPPNYPVPAPTLQKEITRYGIVTITNEYHSIDFYD